MRSRILISFIMVVSSLALFGAEPVFGRLITLDEAFDIATNQSSRGEIIRGNEEVAEQQYFAERIGFLLPKVSLNGEAPAYSNNETFRQFGNLPSKQLVGTKTIDFRSNISLDQSLITGGDLQITANLTRNDETYPTYNAINQSIVDIGQLTNQGFFDFTLTQPLLKPSDAKNNLHNSKDDLELARLSRVDETASLKQEVADAYLGLLELTIQVESANDQYEKASLQANIDSAKFEDEVLAEEDYLASASAQIDAELAKYDAENQRADKQRVLASLLDIDKPSDVEVKEPEVAAGPDEAAKKQILGQWEQSIPLQRAEYQYSKDKRQADYSASSHGLTGNLQANYSLGRGTVETDNRPGDNIKTNSWGLSLNFTFPIWDGGASSAAVKASRMAAEKSRLELESAKKSARAEVSLLLNSIDVSYRKLQVQKKQIEMAQNRVDIAKGRYDDGQISKIDFLQVKIDFLETKSKYIEELKKYITDSISLEYRFGD